MYRGNHNPNDSSDYVPLMIYLFLMAVVIGLTVVMMTSLLQMVRFMR